MYATNNNLYLKTFPIEKRNRVTRTIMARTNKEWKKVLGEKQWLSEKVSFVTWLGRQQSRQKTHDLHSSCWILLRLMFSWFIYPYFPLNIYLVILTSLWCSTGTGCRESWSWQPLPEPAFSPGGNRLLWPQARECRSLPGTESQGSVRQWPVL